MAFRHMIAAALLAAGAGCPSLAHAQQALTLEDALREARAANAVLPIAAYDARIGEARIREARAALGPQFALDGDVHGGTPSAYAGNDGRLQLLAIQPLYDGGALRAGIAIARAESRASGARYRVAQKDLDLQVRITYAEYLAIESELEFKRAGVARLRTYLTSIEARRAAGQGVAADLLKAQVALGSAAADLADVGRRFAQARFSLNDLLGREPPAPLTLTALPPPVEPPDTAPEGWAEAPDVQEADANLSSATAGMALVAAERRPHFSVSADAGVQPAFSAFGTGLNNGQGWGAELTLSLNWPLLDFGGHGSRRTQASFKIAQANQRQLAVRRQVRLAWTTARAELAARYQEVEARTRNAAVALDSYLTAQSLYRGGGATVLEVLDPYTAWIDAQQAAARAVLDYRIAAAQSLRWGTP